MPQANLVVQERRLGVAMNDLAEAQKVLDEKQAELDAVQATYDAAMKSKQVGFAANCWGFLARTSLMFWQNLSTNTSDEIFLELTCTQIWSKDKFFLTK